MTEIILEKIKKVLCLTFLHLFQLLAKKKLHVYEPMFIIFREIQVGSMRYLRWNTQSMQHECCELVFSRRTFSPNHSLTLGTMHMRMQNMNISGIPVHERQKVR